MIDTDALEVESRQQFFFSFEAVSANFGVAVIKRKLGEETIGVVKIDIDIVQSTLAQFNTVVRGGMGRHSSISNFTGATFLTFELINIK